MNNILRLKGTLHSAGGSAPKAVTLPAHARVTVKDVLQKKQQLLAVEHFWQTEQTDINPLVEVHYRSVVAKSNRIRRLLSSSKHPASGAIVGATFEGRLKSQTM
jgi:hypothetical protein